MLPKSSMIPILASMTRYVWGPLVNWQTKVFKVVPSVRLHSFELQAVVENCTHVVDKVTLPAGRHAGHLRYCTSFGIHHLFSLCTMVSARNDGK